MKEIEVKEVRAVLRCMKCNNIVMSATHANANYGSTVLITCEGECRGHNHHKVVAKRMLYEDLGEVSSEEKKPIAPIIVDESVSQPEGMADELIPEGKSELIEEE